MGRTHAAVCLVMAAGPGMVACGFSHGSLPGAQDGGGNGGDAPAANDGGLDPDSVPGAPWLPSYAYRKPVRILPEGASAVLTDVPIGIRVAADADLAAHAQPLGTDFQITAVDGTTVLTHELAFFDSSTGAAELWVKIPSLPLDAETWLFLYYGGLGASFGNPTAVWSNGFKGVWHMSGAAGSASEVDSTNNQNHLSQLVASQQPGGTAGAAAPGVTIGRARHFDGVDDVLTVLDPVNGSLDVGANPFAVSIWLYAITSTMQYQPPLYKGGTNAGNPGYTIFAGSGTWSGKLMDGTGSFFNPPFSPAPINGRWVHLLMTVRRTPNVCTSYRDGAQNWSASFTEVSFDATAELRIGGTTQSFYGYIDEVRVYGRDVDANWVTTEYDNFTKTDFITVGAEQVR